MRRACHASVSSVHPRHQQWEKRMSPGGRTTAEYVEEVCGIKEENEQQHHQLLDADSNEPRVASKSDADEKYLHACQQEPDFPQIKEEEEEQPCITEAEKPFCIKDVEERDKGEGEENKGAEPPSSKSSQHLTVTESHSRRMKEKRGCSLISITHNLRCR
ncbi:uncharacterized protein LOC144043009 isoform X2 [Vanacampus margaritifer]